jgi:uncharacterized membrane protein YgaE (UPF0421/DUF939 family)
MTLKQRALLDVAKVLALGFIGGTLITLAIDQFGLAIVGLTVSVLMLIYLAKIAYDIRLGQLKYEADRVERAIREGR